MWKKLAINEASRTIKQVITKMSTIPRFNDNELEIVLITRSRGETVHKFLKECCEQMRDINTALSIYDSSADDLTKEAVKEFIDKGFIINYQRFPYDTPLGEKYIEAIIKSKAQYIWPIGDSTAVDFREFAQKAYEPIKKGYDLIIDWGASAKDKENIDYTNAGDLYENCLWFMTWLGSEIYSKSLYRNVITEDTKQLILFRMDHEYGSWYPQLGILMETLSKKKNIHSCVVTTGRKGLSSFEKNQAWVKDSYNIWCRDLCLFANTSGKEYKEALDKAIRETWRRLKLDGIYWLCRSRVENGLNKELFDEFDKAGYIDIVSNKKKQIRHWAYMSQSRAKFVYRLLKINNKGISAVVKFIQIFIK